MLLENVKISTLIKSNSPYSGLAQVIRGDGHYNVSQRFGLYRCILPIPSVLKKSSGYDSGPWMAIWWKVPSPGR
jgi:hypothetical protein